MCARELELRRIAPTVLLRRAVETPIIKKINPLEPSLQRDLDDIESVFEPVHPADLIAIISGYRDFLDALARDHELDDDLGIEVEGI